MQQLLFHQCWLDCFRRIICKDSEINYRYDVRQVLNAKIENVMIVVMIVIRTCDFCDQ